MKILKYNLATKVNCGTADEPEYMTTLTRVEMPWSKSNEEIARAEAYNGEYAIEDDGRPEPAETPNQLDVIEAQVTYTAMMTDTLLEV